MKRDVGRMSSEEFDLAVIGGGILGAFIAWDAASRGLTVALLERADFGSGTTSGSGKVLHGGIRQLQYLDMRAAAEAVREQAAICRLAPNLVRPLPFAVPNLGRSRSEAILLPAAAAAWRVARKVLGGVDDLPRPEYLRGTALAQIDQRLPNLGASGALVFHDHQLRSPERLTIAVVHAAHEAGATVANYVQATGLLERDGTVYGAAVEDHLAGQSFDIRARVVVNAAGPWAHALWSERERQRRPVALAKGVHGVFKLPEGRCALALPWLAERKAARVDSGARRIFLMPWEGRLLVGATYAAFDGEPDSCRPLLSEVEDLCDAFARTWPSIGVTLDALRFAYAGVYPIFGAERAATGVYGVSRHPLVVDHGSSGGPSGLITAVAVKLTTARALAQRIVDLAGRRLRRGGPCVTGACPPLPRATLAPTPDGDALSVSDPDRVSRFVACAVEEEMAMTLSDLVFRRTTLGQKGPIEPDLMTLIVGEMGRHLGWAPHTVAGELRAVQDTYARLGVAHLPVSREAAGRR